MEILYGDENSEEAKRKRENINYLQGILYTYQLQKKESIEKNKLYKHEFEVISKKEESTRNDNLKEYEALIEVKKNNNNALN